MSKTVQLTLHDGKRLGLPQHVAMIIFDVSSAPKSKEVPEKAKTLLRYTFDMNQPRVAFVRDDFRHVQNLFPRAMGERGWLNAEDAGTGGAVAFPEGSVLGYEETDAGFMLQIDLPGGQLPVTIKGTYEIVAAMMGLPDDRSETAETAPAALEAPAPASE